MTDLIEQLKQERARLIRSVMEQPVEVLQDIAVLAVASVMHEMINRRLEEQGKSLPAIPYELRILQLAEGEYGIGLAITQDGMGLTSTQALVESLRAKSAA